MATSFLELPQELRALIYSQLSQNDLVHNLRLVCHTIRADIDELCLFKTELDDRRPSWERILQLRLKACKVVHFVSPPPLGPMTTIFHHPHLIRSLKISAAVTPQNFYTLLSDTARHLKELKVTLTSSLLGYQFPRPLSSFHFDKLAHFEIHVSTLSNPPSGETSGFNHPPFLMSAESNAVQDCFREFLLNRMIHLYSLKIQVRCLGFSQVSRFSSVSLNFIAGHAVTLKALDFDLILGHGLPSSEFRPLSDDDLSVIDFEGLKKLKELTCLRIVSSSPVGVNLWIDLIESQKNLTFVELDILPAPPSIFRDLLWRNEETLVSVEVTDLTIWDEEGNCTPFDVTYFENCKSLQKLILDRNVTRRRMFDCAELINLFKLPESLHELALNYFNILSDELLLFCCGDFGGQREQLQTLYLTQCGSTSLYGVDGTVLERIIDLPKIQFVEISPLNFSDPEEKVKLNTILENFGYTQNHSYFQFNLEKATREIPLQFHAFFVASLDNDENEEDEEYEEDFDDEGAQDEENVPGQLADFDNVD